MATVRSGYVVLKIPASIKAYWYSSIRLQLIIISFFFPGGITSVTLYSNLPFYILSFAGIVLAGALVYDSIGFRLILLRRGYTTSGNSE